MKKYVEVELAGKKYPVSFGMMALAKFCKKQNLTLAQMNAQLQSRLDLMGALNLIHIGLQEGARKAKVKLDLSLEELADLIDEDEGALERFFAEFTGAMPQGSDDEGKEPATEVKP